MKGKGIKGAIAASALSAVLCAGMLAGTTFAWFTDTVSSSGNRIMAGNLDITATVAEQTADGAEVSYEVGGETYGFGAAAELTGQAIINEEGWQPGDRNAKLLTVSNAEANLAAVIKLDFVITDNGLTDALWFDFVRVEEGAVTGTLTERPMDTLETFAADLEFTLEAGDDISFILFYGMKEDAGNTYQGESFGVDAYILARQAAEGSEYDEAVARVATAEDLAAAVAEGKTAVLTEDVTVDTIPVNEEGDTAIVLGGNTLTTNQTETVVAGAGKTITITDGNLNATASTDPLRSILQATAGGTIELNDVEFTTNATGLLAMGEDATLRIVNSTVRAFAFCVSTNAGGEENYYPNIEIVDSVLMTTNTNNDGCTGTAVLFNVPGSLSIENSTVIGECGAVFVRGGDAVIRNSVLSRPYEVVGASESNIYMNGTWASGNQAPLATLLIGNRSNSYQYPANVTLENCRITASVDGAKTVYIYGNATEENGATLTYDAATVIAPEDKTVAPVIVGGGWVELDVSVTPDTAQAALDAITSDVDRATVRLSSGSYGQLELSQTKYSRYVPNEGASTSDLYRTIRNLTIIGAEDGSAVVDGIHIQTGHICGSAEDPVTNPVTGVTTDSSVNSYYSYIDADGLTVQNIAFTQSFEIEAWGAAQFSSFKNITVENCSFAGSPDTVTVNTSRNKLISFGGGENGIFENLTFIGCTVKDAFQGIYVTAATNVTVDGCTFENLGHNAIAVQSGEGTALSGGTIVITNNIITNGADRAIRFGTLLDNSSITVNGNKMINTGDAEGQLIKAQSVGEGTTVNLDGNYWNGQELSKAIDISLGTTDKSPIISLS